MASQDTTEMQRLSFAIQSAMRAAQNGKSEEWAPQAYGGEGQGQYSDIRERVMEA